MHCEKNRKLAKVHPKNPQNRCLNCVVKNILYTRISIIAERLKTLSTQSEFINCKKCLKAEINLKFDF